MYLVTFHGVANLTPSINGTDRTQPGWPKGNICTFNPNKRTLCTGAGTQTYVWDRGSSAASVNGFMMVGHNLAGLSATYTIKADGSNPPTTTIVSATTPSSNAPFFAAAACGTARYISLQLSAAATEVGFVSFCKYHDLGAAQLGTVKGGYSNTNAATFPGIREGGATVQATFARVARSTALTIANEIGQTYGATAISNQHNVVGHAGGAHPIALWDADASRLWYGPGTIQITEAMPGYSIVNVSVNEYPVGNTL